MDTQKPQNTVLIIDFGSQTTHLIGRRIRDLGAKIKIITPENALSEISEIKPKGIILSGGPSSVYEKNAPSIDPNIFNLNIPILGICYGFQLAALLLGGEVLSGRKEYGPAEFNVLDKESQLLKNVGEESTVWMNHGDEIVKLPEDFKLIGETNHVPFTCTVSKTRNIYGILFHPEVEHTEYGIEILKNFLQICKVEFSKSKLDVELMIKKIKETVGDSYVIGAVSGGVDSTVAGVLVASAIHDHFIPVFVNNGLMRDDAVENLESIFKEHGVSLKIVQCEEEMLILLSNITDSEEKRKVIGKFYIDIFERELEKLRVEGLGERVKNKEDKNLNASPLSLCPKVEYLMQGTIYSDVIESQGTKHAAKIKSHHNVGGLPEDMKLKLIEPLRELYKDEVREVGRALNLPEEFVMKQPFPGPGYAVRIRGEVNKDRLEKVKMADRIILEELKKTNWLKKIFLSFPVMTGATSTAVKGDGKFMGEVIAIRVIESNDIMSSTWSHLPYELLQKISSRIVNEVPEISRVVYDITTKPPATMEWE